MHTPLVAIIGLPNSGKSTFFNKVLSNRKALTYPEAGTTRDRSYGLTQWNGMSFFLIDTAGIIQRPDSELERNVQKQTAIALEEADLILLVVDGQTHPSNEDYAVAQRLSSSGKPVVLAVNKIDARNTKTQTMAAAYQNLGLNEPFLMSSVNGSGVGDVLDAIVEKLKTAYPPQTSNEKAGLKIAFLGKPNVGKSSLINALLKQDRLVVHHEAGTTRSTVEVPFEYGGREFILLDTAGIKRKWNQDTDVEAAAAFQSIRTLSDTDVAFFVLDGSEEITVQDQIISESILEQGKSVVVILNKMDLLSEEEQSKLLDKLPHYFPQAWFAPVLFSSAKTAQGLELLLKFAVQAFEAGSKKIEEEDLDAFLDKTIEENMPGKKDDQRAPKLYNLKQIAINPPTFKMTVNFPAAVSESWKKWFEKQFRLKFGFEGTPIIIRYARKE
jgi:GTP-binding protein